MAPARQIVIAASKSVADACHNALEQAGFPARVQDIDELLPRSAGQSIDAGLVLYELDRDPVPATLFSLGAPVLVLVPPGHEDRLVRALALGAGSHLIADRDGAYLQVLPALAGRLLDVEWQTRRVREEVAFLSHFDRLTGLPNRRQFTQSLERALARAERHGRRVAILLLDLDRFKLVNDSYGYEGGDELLRAAAQRISQSIRAADLLCRLSGDEFAVLVEDVRALEDAQVVARKLLEDMKLPLLHEGREVPLTLSVGVATFPESAEDPESLVRCADTALYGAKESGGNAMVTYTPALKERVAGALSLERDLRLALQSDQLRVFYQPQVDVDTGIVVGFESLLRWQHPGEGLLTPRRFLRNLEETGQIHKVGLWVLETAMLQLRRWEDEFDLFGLRMGVNVSVRQLREPSLVPSIQQLLESTGVEPSAIELEVTEALFLEDSREYVPVLEALSGLGLRILVDDFGAGYSSVRYLKSMPVHSLKIAGPFVRDLQGGDRDAAIVRAIVGLARGLDLTVAAEGVETEQQLDCLQIYQCDVAQGNLISAPLDPEGARAFLAERESGSPLSVS